MVIAWRWKTHLRAGAAFPYGFFEFTIEGLGVVGTTTVTLYLPSGSGITTYYKYGRTPGDDTNHWYEFVYDNQTETGAEFISDLIILYFADGEKGDDDLTIEGTIHDVGGPAVSSGRGGGADGGGGCFIETITDFIFNGLNLGRLS